MGPERPQLHDFNHIYKVLATSILETISPTRCVVCDMPGSVLCEGCASSLPFIDLTLACPRCGAPFGRTLCTECPIPGSESALLHPEEAFPFTQARAALSFEDGARRIIGTYKDGDELRLDAVIASLLCAAIRGRTMGQMDRSFVPLWQERVRGETAPRFPPAFRQDDRMLNWNVVGLESPQAYR